MAKPASVTIKDVAKRAKVSVASASRAINGVGRISTDTKERILKAAADLNYVPHFGARSLITKKNNIIGVLLPDLYGEFFSEIVRGIDFAARSGGFNILLSSYHNDEAETKSAIAAMRGRVDGMVAMFPFDTDDEFLQSTLNAPMVKIANASSKSKIPLIAIDNANGAKQAVRHLYDCGRRKIAHISGPKSNLEAVDRLRGYREAMEELGLKPNIFEGDFGEQTGYNFASAIARLIKDGSIDAIFVGNDTMAIGLISGFKKLDIKIPEDVAIIGFDNIPIATYLTPNLSSMGVDMQSLGERSVEILKKLIINQDDKQEEVNFKPVLFARASSIGEAREIEENQMVNSQV